METMCYKVFIDITNWTKDILFASLSRQIDAGKSPPLGLKNPPVLMIRAGGFLFMKDSEMLLCFSDRLVFPIWRPLVKQAIGQTDPAHKCFRNYRFDFSLAVR